MSAHRKKSRVESPQSTPPMEGPELLRRCVLALVVALIVARPLIPGEDPGLLSALSEPAGMVLTFLWLAAALGWAIWRAWSRQTAWFGGGVEAGLLGVVVLMFVSAATVARYRHPAWLIAWEWLAVLLALFLVRQLARTTVEQQGVLAAVLATGVSLAAYGVYQYTVEMPQLRAEFLPRPDEPTVDRPEVVGTLAAVSGVGFPANLPWAALALSNRHDPLGPLHRKLARSGIHIDEAQVEAYAQRIEMDHVYSRFAHPNSFAGYLALLLPAMAGCAWTSGRAGRPGWQTLLTTGCVALLAVALWLTHSRGAMLGLLVAAALFGGVFGRRFLLANRRRLVLGVVGLAAVVLLAFLALRGGAGPALGKDSGTARARLDYWAATWKMIGAHPWLGVGPGNFGRYYPRYMLPTAFETITDPHNFVLEVWATAGVFALAALLAAVGSFFWRLGAAARSREPATESEPSGESRPQINWEFYLGGMVGLLLGFLLWVPGKTGDQIIIDGVATGALAFVWFGVFALLERIPWTGQSRAVTLAAGVAALLLNLLVSGGIGFPAVAQPLWVMIALTLSALPEEPRLWPREGWVARMLPMPLLVAITVVYYSSHLQPVLTAASLSRSGLERARLLSEQDPFDDTIVKRPDLHLVKNVLPVLEQAAREDPGNARYQLDLAHWHAELWKYRPKDGNLNKLALYHAGRVHGSLEKPHEFPGLDPESKDGFLAEYRLRLMFADWATPPPVGEKVAQHILYQTRLREQQQQYDIAARMLREVVKRDPTDARLRYQLAELLLRNNPRSEDGRSQARKAQELDGLATVPSRKLSDPQREQIRKWLLAGSPS